MSAKLTVIFYILVCFEIGALLIVLPWTAYWHENFFLYYLASRFRSDAVMHLMLSGYFRGAVTGLGIVNIGMGIFEIFSFRQTVETITLSSATKK